jgi:hypothetical protein
MSFKHRTTIPIPSATMSLSLFVTWPSTRVNLSGCHRRSAARILSFGDTPGECAGDNKNSRMALGRSISSVRSCGTSATGQGIRSNVSALSSPSSGCRWLNSAQRPSYVRHALAISCARRMRSCLRRSSRSACRCCCCCCCCCCCACRR